MEQRLSADAVGPLGDYCRAFAGMDLTPLPDPVWVTLTVVGGRVGAWIEKPPSERDPVATYDAADTEALWEVLPVAHTSLPGTSGWFLAAEESRFDRLPAPDAETDVHQRRMGEFLGYPRDAVDAHIDGAASVDDVRQYVAAGDLTADEAAYEVFVPYTPADTLGSHRAAVERGRWNAARALYADAALAIDADLGTTVERLYDRKRNDIVETAPEPA
jgi:hypothetical protein